MSDSARLKPNAVHRKRRPRLTRAGRPGIFIFLAFALLASSLAPVSVTNPVSANEPTFPTPLPPTGDPTLDNIYYGSVPPGGENAPVLLFVHGLAGLAQDWWTDIGFHGTNDMYFHAYLSGYRTAFVTLNDHGQRNPGNDIQTNAKTLAKQIEAIVDHYNVDYLDIVGHSKGGIDAQAAVVYEGADQWVRNIFTVGSPHWGAELADLLFSGVSSELADALETLANPALYALQTSQMQAFRALTDPLAAQQDVRYYSGAGNNTGAPGTFLRITGTWLAANYGSNDGFVTVDSTALPGACMLFNQPYDHDSVRKGQNAFPWIKSVLREGNAADTFDTAPTRTQRSGIGSILRGGLIGEQLFAASEFPIENEADAAEIVVFVSNPDTRVVLIDPSGQEHSFDSALSPAIGMFDGAYQVVKQITDPAGGNWSVRVEGPESTAYLTMIELDSALDIQLSGLPDDSVRPGEELNIEVNPGENIVSEIIHDIVDSSIIGGDREQRSVRSERYEDLDSDRGRGTGRGSRDTGGNDAPDVPITAPDSIGTFVLETVISGQTASGSLFERTIVHSLGVTQEPTPASQHRQPGDPIPGEFEPAGPQGLCDRDQSWPWAMQWWNGYLYVGTNASYRCVSAWTMKKFITDIIPALGDLFPYPPGDLHMDCAEQPQDLPMQAEIWRWSPHDSSWEMMYRSPNDVPNPDHPGSFVPRDNGFRSMALHVEPDGTEAMYVAGVNTRAMWSGEVPPPRILRTTDGVNFEPIPQDPGTFLGDIDKASFRSLTSHQGKLFVLLSSIHGNGVIIGSDNPAAGNNAWAQVSPEPWRFFEMASFNGWLYAGTYDAMQGYAILKTRGIGPPPNAFEIVIPPGAYLSPHPGKGVASMEVHRGRLYIGTDDPAEIVRINPDDSWDLVIGTPRMTPDGMKFPISGLSAGFGDDFNEHIWRMTTYQNQLYAGTYNSAITWKNNPFVAQELRHIVGMDLMHSDEGGWYFIPHTSNGFRDPFSFGARNFSATPHGLFLGIANDYHGMVIRRMVPGYSAPVPPPTRLEVAQHNGQPLLSWNPANRATSYVVMRSKIEHINLPTLPWGWPPPDPEMLGQVDPALLEQLREFGFEPANMHNRRQYPGVFEQIGETSKTRFVDSTAEPGVEYLYLVLAKGPGGGMSKASNVVQVPWMGPPITFTTMLNELERLNKRGHFTGSRDYLHLRQRLQYAQSSAQRGSYGRSVQYLQEYKSLLPRMAKDPERTDLEVMADKVIRRLQLANEGYVHRSDLN